MVHVECHRRAAALRSSFARRLRRPAGGAQVLRVRGAGRGRFEGETGLARCLLDRQGMRQPKPVAVLASALLSSVVLSAACATPAHNQPPQQAQLTQAVSVPDRLRPPEHLSDGARAILKERMASHARNMGGLMSAIMILQYDEIRAGARRIVDDGSLSRPLANDATELNSALPEKFFLYQDDLRLEARTLAEAAGRQHPFDVADSYGRLSQVCVRCHATYRQGR